MSSTLLSASLEPTTISQLNDDCLIELFKYLNHLELSAIADTCTRFRDLAIDYFPRARLEVVDFGMYFGWGVKNNERNRNKFLIRRMAKHFSQFIVKVYYRSHIAGLVVPLAQCTNLIELHLHNTIVSDETATMMRPLLGRLQTLAIRFADTSALLWRMLPLWAVELRYLQLVFLRYSETYSETTPTAPQFVQKL